MRGSGRSAPEQFEFQMLYGIRRDLQQRIVDLGYRLRCTCRTGLPGIRISCAGWRSGRRM